MVLDRVFDILRVRSLPPEPGLITLADRARDAGLWELAAQLYRKALNRNPRDASLWDECGNALKESAELRDPDIGELASLVTDERKPRATAAGWTAVTHAKIRCLKMPSFNHEVALFVTHSPHGRLKPHVPYYLERLKRQNISVVLIVNADRPSEAANINFPSTSDGVFVRQNEGYDFAAWAHVLRLHPELLDAEIVYLLNDSVFGPTNVKAFRDILTRLRNSRADVCGLTENFDRTWHIQSYFLALKRCALSSARLRKFIDSIVSYTDIEDVINEFEVRFASSLRAVGLNCEALFASTDLRDPTIYHWKRLLQSGFPFVKVKTIRDGFIGVDISDWRQALAAQGYDVLLAERTLTEFSTSSTGGEGGSLGRASPDHEKQQSQRDEVLTEYYRVMRRFSMKRRRPNAATLAERARDAGQWELAAQLYRKALDRNPQDAALWVQYGHALKESGELRDPEKLAEAEVCYRRALSYDSSVADTHLQLGHVLKLQSRTKEAEASYLRAVVLDQAMPHPLHELIGLGWSEAQIAELRHLVNPDHVPEHRVLPTSPIVASESSANTKRDGPDPFGRSCNDAAPQGLCRGSTMGDRYKILTAGIDPEFQKGLEFGALDKPTVDPSRGDVRFIDFTDTASLREEHRAFPERANRLVEVNYVWPGSGSLADVIGTGELFDWAIASHVIEHVPNMLGWLRGIAEVLRPGAVFNLAIPDCRFTFDVDCPRSTIGQVIEADLLNYRHPSIRQAFDYCFHAKAIEPAAIWHSQTDVKRLPAFAGEGAPQLAYDHARKILSNGKYIDSHCWIVTPLSYIDILEGMSIVGVMPPLVPTWFNSTEIGGCEFFCSFRRADKTIPPDDVKREQLTALSRIRSEIEQDVRLGRLLAGS
jgi:tetratricopeptide (TPR) repeat protein